MEIPVSARISYVTSSDEDYVSLEVQDEKSLVTFVCARFKLEDAYKLFMNRQIKGVAEVRGLNLVGKKREMQDIKLTVTKHGDDDSLKLACVDWMEKNPGWQISVGDMKWNSHKAQKQKDRWSYSLHAVRYT